MTHLELLEAELDDYRTKRRQATEKLADDEPEYAARVDAMWQHAIGVKLAQIERERSKE